MNFNNDFSRLAAIDGLEKGDGSAIQESLGLDLEEMTRPEITRKHEIRVNIFDYK